MTDRHAAYIVVLDDDIREDDAEGTLNAIRHIRFVAGVTPVIDTYEFHVARVRRDCEWRDALGKLAVEGPGKDGGE
jgi:hypothetical protein